jgi:DNA-binding NtrC family response regulator
LSPILKAKATPARENKRTHLRLPDSQIKNTDMKRNPSIIIHLTPVPSILKIVKEELQGVWGPEVNILSFTDSVSAGRQVLFAPELPITLGIVDIDTPKANHFIAALQDIYPRCPIVLTTHEGDSLDRTLLPSDKFQVLTKPFTVGQLVEAAERCLTCTPTR